MDSVYSGDFQYYIVISFYYLETYLLKNFWNNNMWNSLEI